MAPYSTRTHRIPIYSPIYSISSPIQASIFLDRRGLRTLGAAGPNSGVRPPYKSGHDKAIEDFDDMDKLGLGFTSTDPLEQVEIGDASRPRPAFVNKNLFPTYRSELIKLLKEYPDCFA
jgi:hypothetical protein